jgi:hypothetical protein
VRNYRRILEGILLFLVLSLIYGLLLMVSSPSYLKISSPHRSASCILFSLVLTVIALATKSCTPGWRHLSWHFLLGCIFYDAGSEVVCLLYRLSSTLCRFIGARGSGL